MKKTLSFSTMLFFLFSFFLFSACRQSGSAGDAEQIVNYYDSTFWVNGTVKKVPRFPDDYKYVQVNDIPPRFQWNGNNGYCGETCIITAGLYNGQYISQYDVRQLSLVADYPDSAGYSSQDDQISFGRPAINSNAFEVAQTLELNTDTISTKTDSIFICWIKKNVALGHPVMIGVLNNVIALNEDTSVYGGDDQYDHIVPVIGFASKKPLLNQNGEAEYNPEDIILFSDNGIYTPGDGCNNIQCVPDPAVCVPYYTQERIDTIFKTRVEANTNGIYALQKKLCDSCFLYGVSFSGIKQEGDKKFFPVRMYTGLNYEAGCSTVVPDTAADNPCCMYQGAAFGQGTINKRPKLGTFDLTAIVSGLENGKEYVLLRFDQEKDIPSLKPAEKTVFTAQGTTYRIKRKIQSDEKVFYRVIEK